MRVRHFLTTRYDLTCYEGQFSAFDGRTIDTNYDLRAHVACINIDKQVTRAWLHSPLGRTEYVDAVRKQMRDYLRLSIPFTAVEAELFDYMHMQAGFTVAA